MSLINNIVLNKKNNFDKIVSSIFPRHKTFLSLDSVNNNVLNYKKPSKINLLNWFEQVLWPSENTNEFLSYQISNLSGKKFLKENLEVDKDQFLYANLMHFCENNNETIINNLVNELVNMCQINTLIILPTWVKTSDTLLCKWAEQKYTIIDIHSFSNFFVYINYNYKKTKISNPGQNAADRQRISRKSARWKNQLASLKNTEQDYIIMNLISDYLKDNTNEN